MWHLSWPQCFMTPKHCTMIGYFILGSTSQIKDLCGNRCEDVWEVPGACVRCMCLMIFKDTKEFKIDVRSLPLSSCIFDDDNKLAHCMPCLSWAQLLHIHDNDNHKYLKSQTRCRYAFCLSDFIIRVRLDLHMYFRSTEWMRMHLLTSLSSQLWIIDLRVPKSRLCCTSSVELWLAMPDNMQSLQVCPL